MPLNKPPVVRPSIVRGWLLEGTKEENRQGLRDLFAACDKGPRFVRIDQETMRNIERIDALKEELMGRKAPTVSVVVGLEPAQLDIWADSKCMHMMGWPVAVSADPGKPTHMFGGDETSRCVFPNPTDGGWHFVGGESVKNLCKTGKFYLQCLLEMGLGEYRMITADLTGIGSALGGSGMSFDLKTPAGQNTKKLVDATLAVYLHLGIQILAADTKYGFEHIYNSLSGISDGRPEPIDVPVDPDKGLKRDKDGELVWGCYVRVHVFSKVRPDQDSAPRTVLLVGSPHFCTASFTDRTIMILHANSVVAGIRGHPIDEQHTIGYYNAACGGFLPEEEQVQLYKLEAEGYDDEERAKWNECLKEHKSSIHAAHDQFCHWRWGKAGGEAIKRKAQEALGDDWRAYYAGLSELARLAILKKFDGSEEKAHHWYVQIGMLGAQRKQAAKSGISQEQYVARNKAVQLLKKEAQAAEAEHAKVLAVEVCEMQRLEREHVQELAVDKQKLQQLHQELQVLRKALLDPRVESAEVLHLRKEIVSQAAALRKAQTAETNRHASVWAKVKALEREQALERKQRSNQMPLQDASL